jgi:hypothetical protein
MSTHPLTDALPSYMDALALRQACGEIEAGLRAVIELAAKEVEERRRWGGSMRPVVEMLLAALEERK